MIQFVLNGLAMYGWVAIIAISFAIIFRVTGFFHFAHGLSIAIGPYCLFSLLRHGAPFSLSLVLALTCSGAVGICIHLFVYRKISQHTINPLALLLASLGVYLIGQNIISLLYGDDPITLSHVQLQSSLTIFGGSITQTNCLCVLLSIFVALAAGPILANTGLGKSMRAIASDRRLAAEIGIPIDRVMILTYFIGSALAGLGGIMISYDTSARPTMGIDALLPGIVAVVLGGEGGIARVWFASLLLAMTTHLGVMYINSLWQQVIVFAVLLVFLLFRAFINRQQIAIPKVSA